MWNWKPTIRILFVSDVLLKVAEAEVTLLDGEVALCAAAEDKSGNSLRDLAATVRTAAAACCRDAGATGRAPCASLVEALPALRAAGDDGGQAQAHVWIHSPRRAHSLCAEASLSRRAYLEEAGLASSDDNLARLESEAQLVLDVYIDADRLMLEQRIAPAGYAEALVSDDQWREWSAALRLEAFAGMTTSAAATWACHVETAQSEQERATRTSIMAKA